jgi:hypothetical protein
MIHHQAMAGEIVSAKFRFEESAYNKAFGMRLVRVAAWPQFLYPNFARR